MRRTNPTAFARAMPGATRRRRVLVALCAALALAASCDLQPETGPALHERCSDEDSDPGQDVSFQRDILDGIIARRPGGCLGCHDPGMDPPLGTNLGGLELTSYATLRAGGVNSGADIVVAGQPCSSVLFLKVGAGPPFGARMPANGPPFLSDADVALLHDWIAEGARDN